MLADEDIRERFNAAYAAVLRYLSPGMAWCEGRGIEGRGVPGSAVMSASIVGRERVEGMRTVTGRGTGAGVEDVFAAVTVSPVLLAPSIDSVTGSVSVWPVCAALLEAVAVALDDDTGNVTDALTAAALELAVALTLAVAVELAAPDSAVAGAALVTGDSAFKMSVTCTKKNPSTTGSSLDNREFNVLCGLPVFSDLP
jgi:hypothetical protein